MRIAMLIIVNATKVTKVMGMFAGQSLIHVTQILALTEVFASMKDVDIITVYAKNTTNHPNAKLLIIVNLIHAMVGSVSLVGPVVISALGVLMEILGKTATSQTLVTQTSVGRMVNV